MELIVHPLNDLLQYCLCSKYEPKICYETKLQSFKDPLYENCGLCTIVLRFLDSASRQVK